MSNFSVSHVSFSCSHFRMNSTIVGQRKPKENKRKRKNRNHQPRERSYSEGEASDYENQQNGACNGNCRKKSTGHEANNNNNNNHVNSNQNGYSHKTGDTTAKGKHKSNDKNGLMFDIEI